MALHKHALQLSSAKTIEEITENTLDAAELTLGFDRADFCTVEDGYLKFRGNRGAPMAYSVMPLSGRGITVRAVKIGKSVRVTDTRKDALYVDGRGFDWKTPATALSELAVPVLIDGQTVAVLNVESAQPNKFTVDDQTLLETLAIHVASELRRLRDIATLRNSEQRVRELIEHLRIGVCVQDSKGSVRMWNKAAESMTGYSRAEVTGHERIWEWLYPDRRYRDEITTTINTVLANKLLEENIETNIRCKDGETKIVSWNFQGVYDQENQRTGSVALGRDVTHEVGMKKEFERYSQHLERLVDERTRSVRYGSQRLHAIVQGSPEGIIVTDQKREMVECNQAAVQLYGCSSREQLIGRNLSDLVAMKDRASASDAFTKAIKQEVLRNLRYAMLKDDGREFPAEMSLSIVKNAAESPLFYVAIVRDLTEQIEIQDRLLKSERMAVIGETAAMMGHDLRNPLQGISLAVHLLRQKYGSGDSETTEALGIIENSLSYADNMIRDILDYSREIRLDLRETTPKAIIQAALLRVSIPENVTVRNATQDDQTIMVDVSKAERLFVNLIGNALDAMPKGGQLTIASEKTGAFLEIKLSDTGEGIRDDMMRDLWKPLKTTKTKGMGLGLPICKRIVEAHAGTIEAQSAQGKGTTFTIRLPIRL